jgi:hypothetical protein
MQSTLKKKQECIAILEEILISHSFTDQVILKIQEVLEDNILQLFSKNDQVMTCIYSSTSYFKPYKIYPIDIITTSQTLDLVYKNDIIGYMVTENSLINKLDNSIQVLLQDVTSIGIILNTYSSSKYKFIQFVCLSIVKLINKITKLISKISARYNDVQSKIDYKEIDKSLMEMINLVYDAVDYAEISESQIEIQEDIVSIKLFLDETCRIIESMNKKVTVELKKTPKYLVFDKKHLQQLLLIIFKKMDVGIVNLIVEYNKPYLEITTNEIKNINSIEATLTFQDKMTHSRMEDFVFKNLCTLLTVNVTLSHQTIKFKIFTKIPQ